MVHRTFEILQITQKPINNVALTKLISQMPHVIRSEHRRVQCFDEKLL